MARLTGEQILEVERWMPLVDSMVFSRVHRYRGRFEAGDVRAWAALGLIDAVLKFDPAWSTPEQRDLFFSVYARTRIAGSIVDGFRRESSVRRYRVGDQYFYANPVVLAADPAELDRVDEGDIAAIDDRYEARSVVAAVLDDLEHLPVDPRHRRRVEPADVLRLLVRGYSGRDVAARLGVDESRISQIVNRMIRPRLAARLAEDAGG